MEKNKTTYTVRALYEGTNPLNLSLESVDRNGNHEWIDTTGNLIQTPPVRDQKHPENNSRIASLTLLSTESTPIPGNDEGKSSYKVFVTKSYVPEEDTVGYTLEEQIENKIAKQTHRLLKLHPRVVIKNAQGGNENPNQSEMATFELIENTKLIKNESVNNDKVIEALSKAQDLRENNPESFIEVCYAYDIAPIDGVPIEKLYNIVHKKILGNPQSFLTVLENQDMKLLAMVKKAQYTNYNEELIIVAGENSFYYFEGEIIGANDDEMIHNFKTFPRKMESFKRKLGMKEIETTVTRLPEDKSVEPLTDRQKSYDRNEREQRLKRMKADMAGGIGVFPRFVKRCRQEPLKKTEHIAQLEQELIERKDKYSDIFDEYSALVIQLRAEYAV